MNEIIATHIPKKIQLNEWMLEMIQVEEHLRKISLPYHNYFITCSSCGWKVSYLEACDHFIINNNIRCHDCKEGYLRLKSIH
jgi:transcription initiation factor IIE alpha subunit